MRFFLIALLGLFLLTGTARAEEGMGDYLHEVKLGVLHHDQDNLWSNYSRESGVDINAEVILNLSTELWGGDIRPVLGGSVNSVGDTSKVYAAARWETTVGDNGLFAVGVGGALHNGETKLVRNDKKALGSKALFYFPIEAGYRLDDHNTVSLFFDHVSNAWLADPNEGMDTLGIRYGYRF